MKHTYRKTGYLAAVLTALAMTAGCNQAVETGNLPYLLPTPGLTETQEDTGVLPPEETPDTAGTEEAITPTPTSAPEPTAEPEATPTPKPEKTKDDFAAADFFENAVFAGDSVLSHFYWKVPFYDKETFGGSDFLVAVSYSVREALKPVSETSIHPMFKGEQRQIWESMKLLEPKRVFLFFGLNDIGVNGVDGFLENYKKMIGNIKEAVPEAKLYIISITPMRADCEGKGTGLTNAKITEANGKIQEYCAENEMGYIDVATMLLDETGALNTDYSDGTNVHLTKQAYQMWKDVLVDYATDTLLAEYEAAE